uniref:DUF6868 domain-containing protein n=1 Tax=Candidatus Kentrum sp. FW TaxID=2126338 RepID=A0A450T839_9GAMM|nr:MAG: hypothetical protein BECKFW1821A_GA0114235_11349 [Candidatus Kentron sp. FW]
MTTAMLGNWLGWCSLINMGVLVLWFLVFSQGRHWIYRLHTQWFRITEEEFDHAHYVGMVVFKILVLVMNIVPYISLRIIG